MVEEWQRQWQWQQCFINAAGAACPTRFVAGTTVAITTDRPWRTTAHWRAQVNAARFGVHSVAALVARA
jgi:hypothetical protein